MGKLFYKNANCMGYALGRNKWLIPHGWQESWEEIEEFMYRHYSDRVRFYKQYKSREGQHMVQQLPKGRGFVVLRLNDQFYDDFHFVKRMPSGHWREKRGTRKAEPISQKAVAAKKWPMIGSMAYDSDYYVFEVVQ